MQIFPYGFYSKLKSSSGLIAKIFRPKLITPPPLAKNALAEDGSKKLLIDLRGLSEIAKPQRKFLISKKENNQKEKVLKIAELKSSTQNLESLNSFFLKLKDDIFGKANQPAMRFLKFLKSPQGNYLANHFINKALFNEASQIQRDIKAFDEADDHQSQGESKLLKSSGYIATKENSRFEAKGGDESIKKTGADEKASNYLIRSIDLVNHLGDLGLENLVYKLVGKIDEQVDKLNRKYPWIDPSRLDLATLALRNTNHNDALSLGINDKLHLEIEELLDTFKEDLENARDLPRIDNPKLTKLINKLIDKTDFKHADATSIRDFYMHASLKGYTREAEKVLSKAILQSPILKEPLEIKEHATVEENSKFKDAAELEQDYLAGGDLVSALIEIQENLGMEYFEQDHLPQINQAIVDYLKNLKTEDFASFTQVFDQIINLDDKKKYPTLGDQIFSIDSNIFFYDKPFPLFDLSYLLGCFTDNDSKFKQNLFQDYYEENQGQDLVAGELPSVYLNIKNFNLHNRISKKDTNSLAEDDLRKEIKTDEIEDFKKKLLENELINKLIDKLAVEVCDVKEISLHYFSLCDEGHIESANNLLNKKLEQLNDLEEGTEKYHEFADLLELFGYVKERGLINENSLNLNNKVLKTYAEILDNDDGNLEKGFQSLIEIIKDEKLSPQYSIMLLNQLTQNLLAENIKAADCSMETVKQTSLNSEQKSLLVDALRQRIFLYSTNQELSETQLKRQKDKRINELADLLQLSNQLLDLKIFNANDIEQLRKDYGDWNIIKRIDKEDIPSIFNYEMQESLFSKIPEYRLDNDSSKNQDSPLYILINKAFETTLSLGNSDKLEKLLNQTLKETPIFPGNVKNDLKLSLMVTDYLLSAELLRSQSGKASQMNELENVSTKEGLAPKTRTDLKVDELAINRLKRKMRSHLEKLNLEQKELRREEREIAKIRDRDFKDKPYANYSRLISEISKPFINQAPALDNNNDLLTTAFCRVLDDYAILKRRYQDFPVNEIDKETFQLILHAEDRLDRLGAIDRTVFMDRINKNIS